MRLLSALLALLVINYSQGQQFVFEDFDDSVYLKVADQENLRAAQFNDAQNYRLTDDTYPLEYDVGLRPDLTSEGYYSGEIYARFKANRPVSSVVINAEGIKIEWALIVVLGDQPTEANSILESVDEETWSQYQKV